MATLDGSLDRQNPTVAVEEPVTVDGTVAIAGDVSVGGIVSIESKDGPNIDAFSRWRVSNPETLFDSTLQYDTGPLIWENILNNGAVTHNATSSSVTLSTVAGTSGNYAYRQTRQYIRYQPGKSQLIFLTGVLGAKKANVRQRVGYFDVNDGAFFEQDGTNLKVVLRTSTGGSPNDDNFVNQGDWNLDTMDGNGPSGINLDMSKTQIFVIDLQWLGVGRVRMGFDIGGSIYYCHQFRNANTTLTLPYMKTANLPCRWEIHNTGAADGATTLLAVCTSVISEGGFEDDRGYTFSANNGITTVGVTTRRAILSIRPNTLNSIPFRGAIIPLDFSVTTATNSALIEIVYNPTFTTGGGALTWTTTDSNSGVQYCRHADANNGAFTDGVVVDSHYSPAGTGTARVGMSSQFSSRYPLTLDHAGNNPVALSVVATSFSQTSSNTATLNWKEIR